MNAADVLAEQSLLADMPFTRKAAVRILLAHGEQGQGVTILHDGTLWVFEEDTSASRGPQDAVSGWLQPLSAEAGDTDG